MSSAAVDRSSVAFDNLSSEQFHQLLCDRGVTISFEDAFKLNTEVVEKKARIVLLERGLRKEMEIVVVEIIKGNKMLRDPLNGGTPPISARVDTGLKHSLFATALAKKFSLTPPVHERSVVVTKDDKQLPGITLQCTLHQYVSSLKGHIITVGEMIYVKKRCFKWVDRPQR